MTYAVELLNIKKDVYKRQILQRREDSMAAKKKTKKAQKKKQAAENEILVYIYALVLIRCV